jgi:hypothetical protein
MNWYDLWKCEGLSLVTGPTYVLLQVMPKPITVDSSPSLLGQKAATACRVDMRRNESAANQQVPIAIW